MEELFKLLTQFADCLEAQIEVFRELLPILEKEESLIAAFDLSDFEKLVVQKDQISKRLDHLENQRVNQLRKICYLISYDARGKVPNLREFIVIIGNYTKNVKNLLDADMYAQLLIHNKTLGDICISYRELFATTAPRIYRNQATLKKVLANFKLSMSLLETEVTRSHNYDNRGKKTSRPTHGDGWSSVRVKA